jgi:predicted nucleic acid-binding Zn ribbon protein
MRCPKCGKEIPNDSIFCEACGARIKKSKKALWIILNVILVSISAVVSFTIIKEQQEYQAAQKQQELEQQLEAEYQAKLEAERKAELVRQGYVDLGLPSGTYWKETNESGFYNYDNAVSKFGDKLPTKVQFVELKNECEWTWTGYGYKVMGPNGNSITLPAAGERICDGDVAYVGTSGNYWSSTPDDSDYMWGLFFYSSEVNMYRSAHCLGFSVRLVQ